LNAKKWNISKYSELLKRKTPIKACLDDKIHSKFASNLEREWTNLFINIFSPRNLTAIINRRCNIFLFTYKQQKVYYIASELPNKLKLVILTKKGKLSQLL
jgi:hypothetical protein